MRVKVTRVAGSYSITSESDIVLTHIADDGKYMIANGDNDKGYIIDIVSGVAYAQGEQSLWLVGSEGNYIADNYILLDGKWRKIAPK